MSLRPDAVKATGIRHFWIAEIGPAAGECVGCQRRPDWRGEIRAHFHHDGDICCPGDDETEPVCLYAKARTEVQDQRVRKQPQRSRTTAKRRVPACGSGKVIDDRIVGVKEYVRTNAGGAAAKVY